MWPTYGKPYCYDLFAIRSTTVMRRINYKIIIEATWNLSLKLSSQVNIKYDLIQLGSIKQLS